MGIELDLLNAIQTIHTPALDNIMCESVKKFL